MKEALYKKVVITSVREETKNFKIFTLEPEGLIHYKAGQYLTLVHQPGPKEVRRSYSMISAPLLHEPVAIGVKRMDNGVFSRQLVDHAKPGDELVTTGTGGFFTLPETIEAYQQVIFFAAGAGITPIYSLLKTCLHLHPHLRVMLVYSNSSPERTAFLQPVKELSESFKERFTLHLLFSNQPNLREARLNRDLLLELFDRCADIPVAKTLVYVCGPESYIRMVTFVLQERGVPPTLIRRENFIVPPRPAAIHPPDTADRKVFVKLGDQEMTVEVHYPDSILRAAKKQGFVLPYSCEAGRCGNCAARCVSGSVWHSYNEVLTERELKDGYILTCTGHPVGGDVHLLIG